MTELKTAFERLWNLPFPDVAGGDELADWIMELAEFESYIAGIASTILECGSTDTDTASVGRDLEKFGERLMSIRVTTDDDRLRHEECKSYLEALRGLVKELP